MPITKELENIRKFESVGFTHEQAEILAETLEQSHIDGQHALKDQFNKLENRMIMFENRMDKLETKTDTIENKIDSILKVTDGIDLHIKAGQSDLLLKIFAIAAGCTSIGVAISKLL